MVKIDEPVRKSKLVKLPMIKMKRKAERSSPVRDSAMQATQLHSGGRALNQDLTQVGIANKRSRGQAADLNDSL